MAHVRFDRADEETALSIAAEHLGDGIRFLRITDLILFIPLFFEIIRSFPIPWFQFHASRRSRPD